MILSPPDNTNAQEHSRHTFVDISERTLHILSEQRVRFLVPQCLGVYLHPVLLDAKSALLC